MFQYTFSFDLVIANGCLPVLLGWVNAVTAGHSKVMATRFSMSTNSDNPKPECLQRISTNAIVLIAYGIGNAAGPFMWKKQYEPRYAWPSTPVFPYLSPVPSIETESLGPS